MAQIKEELIKHFKPKPPVIAERFTFHKRDQQPGEPIKEFVIELRQLASTCNFGGFLEEQGSRNHGGKGGTGPPRVLTRGALPL